MAKSVQLRRGTAAEHESFVGAIGEVTVVTDSAGELRVHDGETVGGVPVTGSADQGNAVPTGLVTVPPIVTLATAANEQTVVSIEIDNKDPGVDYTVVVQDGEVDTSVYPFQWTLPDVAHTKKLRVDVFASEYGKAVSGTYAEINVQNITYSDQVTAVTSDVTASYFVPNDKPWEKIDFSIITSDISEVNNFSASLETLAVKNARPYDKLLVKNSVNSFVLDKSDAALAIEQSPGMTTSNSVTLYDGAAHTYSDEGDVYYIDALSHVDKDYLYVMALCNFLLYVYKVRKVDNQVVDTITYKHDYDTTNIAGSNGATPDFSYCKKRNKLVGYFPGTYGAFIVFSVDVEDFTFSGVSRCEVSPPTSSGTVYPLGATYFGGVYYVFSSLQDSTVYYGNINTASPFTNSPQYLSSDGSSQGLSYSTTYKWHKPYMLGSTPGVITVTTNDSTQLRVDYLKGDGRSISYGSVNHVTHCKSGYDFGSMGTFYESARVVGDSIFCIGNNRSSGTDVVLKVPMGNYPSADSAKVFQIDQSVHAREITVDQEKELVIAVGSDNLFYLLDFDLNLIATSANAYNVSVSQAYYWLCDSGNVKALHRSGETTVTLKDVSVMGNPFAVRDNYDLTSLGLGEAPSEVYFLDKKLGFYYKNNLESQPVKIASENTLGGATQLYLSSYAGNDFLLADGSTLSPTNLTVEDATNPNPASVSSYASTWRNVSNSGNPNAVHVVEDKDSVYYVNGASIYSRKLSSTLAASKRFSPSELVGEANSSINHATIRWLYDDVVCYTYQDRYSTNPAKNGIIVYDFSTSTILSQKVVQSNTAGDSNYESRLTAIGYDRFTDSIILLEHSPSYSSSYGRKGTSIIRVDAHTLDVEEASAVPFIVRSNNREFYSKQYGSYIYLFSTYGFVLKFSCSDIYNWKYAGSLNSDQPYADFTLLDDDKIAIGYQIRTTGSTGMYSEVMLFDADLKLLSKLDNAQYATSLNYKCLLPLPNKQFALFDAQGQATVVSYEGDNLSIVSNISSSGVQLSNSAGLGGFVSVDPGSNTLFGHTLNNSYITRFNLNDLVRKCKKLTFDAPPSSISRAVFDENGEETIYPTSFKQLPNGTYELTGYATPTAPDVLIDARLPDNVQTTFTFKGV